VSGLRGDASFAVREWSGCRHLRDGRLYRDQLWWVARDEVVNLVKNFFNFFVPRKAL